MVEHISQNGSAEAKQRSLWLQEVLGNAPVEQPPLEGAARADVAIVGGGYVGLWTAIRIKEKDPSCDVVLLEQDICGGGASGRNGGMVLSWWPKLSSLVKHYGAEEALRLGHASEAAVRELHAFCEENDIQANFRQGGFLWTATTQAQIGAWEGVVKLCEELGVKAFEHLEPAEVSRRTGSPMHLAGVLDPNAATVQPAALARGLRRVALEKGVRIFEGTRVTNFTRGRPLAVSTERALLAAEKLVIATNAWAASIRELRLAMAVMSSEMVATAPIPERLEEIGWTGGEGITDSQMMVDYYRTTGDGRIAFGKGGGSIAFGGRIDRRFDRNKRLATAVAAELRRYYPTLRDVVITHDWSGPIDRTQDSLPIIGRLGGRDHIVYGVGWSGNGVGPSVVGGKMLASLVLGLEDEWSRSPLVDRNIGRFPPEPIRFVGAQVVRQAVLRKERAEACEEAPRAFDARLARLAPAGLEDKE
jgi:putative aminophosphonate oxidoreductase